MLGQPGVNYTTLFETNCEVQVQLYIDIVVTTFPYFEEDFSKLHILCAHATVTQQPWYDSTVIYTKILGANVWRWWGSGSDQQAPLGTKSWLHFLLSSSIHHAHGNGFLFLIRTCAAPSRQLPFLWNCYSAEVGSLCWSWTET